MKLSKPKKPTVGIYAIYRGDRLFEVLSHKDRVLRKNPQWWGYLPESKRKIEKFAKRCDRRVVWELSRLFADVGFRITLVNRDMYELRVHIGDLPDDFEWKEEKKEKQ